ncbi:phosphatase PAP2 family protein [Oleiharenicola lentus]|uniref:phosphatase PAP2 family protein n=1 Tax=Oleiharenicola lentus TaxID=2508720 RepID=UPI003F6802D4
MKLLHSFRIFLLTSVLVTSGFAAPVAGRYLKTDDFDATKAIPVAPKDDSLTTIADLEVVYQVQQRRTPEQIAVSGYFADNTVFQYDAAIGTWFTAVNLPKTSELFLQVYADRFAISSKGKEVWNRPRPPLLDKRIRVTAPLPKSGSYPSGHSTQAFLWAGLLAEIFPEQRAALRERAELVAWSRVTAGVHYPSDIVAGRMLGDALVKEFMKVPAFRTALDEVKAEVTAYKKAHPEAWTAQ